MINRVVLVGRITKDPDLRKTKSGISVVSFTLACNRRISKDGEQEADFINCQAWRGSADFMVNYVKQGTLLGIEGRIQTRNYKDQSDRTVYVTEIVCDSVQILAQKRENKEGNTNYNVGYNQAQNTQNESYTKDYSNEARSYMDGLAIDLDPDDLPF